MGNRFWLSGTCEIVGFFFNNFHLINYIFYLIRIFMKRILYSCWCNCNVQQSWLDGNSQLLYKIFIAIEWIINEGDYIY